MRLLDYARPVHLPSALQLWAADAIGQVARELEEAWLLPIVAAASEAAMRATILHGQVALGRRAHAGSDQAQRLAQGLGRRARALHRQLDVIADLQDPQLLSAEAAALRDALFPGGLGHHVRGTHEEQCAAHERLVDQLRAPAWEELVAALGLGPQVGPLQAQADALRAALLRSGPPTREEVMEADRVGEEALLLVKYAVLTRYGASDPDRRDALLAPLVQAWDRVRDDYRGRARKRSARRRVGISRLGESRPANPVVEEPRSPMADPPPDAGAGPGGPVAPTRPTQGASSADNTDPPRGTPASIATPLDAPPGLPDGGVPQDPPTSPRAPAAGEPLPDPIAAIPDDEPAPRELTPPIPMVCSPGSVGSAGRAHAPSTLPPPHRHPHRPPWR
jgi:hypothetical protein